MPGRSNGWVEARRHVELQPSPIIRGRRRLRHEARPEIAAPGNGRRLVVKTSVFEDRSMSADAFGAAYYKCTEAISTPKGCVGVSYKT